MAKYSAVHTGAIICTADDFFLTNTGSYIFVKDEIGLAHNWCKTKCKEVMERGLPIIANTSTTESELGPYFNLAKQYEYKVFCLVVENRHGGENIHIGPIETIQNMKNQFTIKL